MNLTISALNWQFVNFFIQFAVYFVGFMSFRSSGKVAIISLNIACFLFLLNFPSGAVIKQIFSLFVLSSMSLNLFLIYIFFPFLSAVFWVIYSAVSSSSLIFSLAGFNSIGLCLCQDLGPFKLPPGDPIYQHYLARVTS